MTRPLLPPNGVFIPTRLIYDLALPSSLLQTWSQLRGLAWGGTVTPDMRLSEIASILKKSPSTLYRHLSSLRNLDVLSWHTTATGSIIVSFDEHKVIQPGYAKKPPILNSQNRELPYPPSQPPEVYSDSHPSSLKDSELTHDIYPKDELLGGGERECEGERGGLKSQNCANNDPSTAVSVYRQVAHLTPSPAQRRILERKVRDLSLWERTLEHWIGHGWNPRNLAGMLDLYQRGGASGCRSCFGHNQASRAKVTAQEASLEALEGLRIKLSSRTRPGGS
jgi:DNA-binding transcriptional ArsR family regulator